MAGKSKNKRGTAPGFKNLTDNKCKQKHGSAEKRDGNCCVYADSCWAILSSILMSDSLISQIFHHTQPIGIFAQWVSV
jgi:hypothetical protein